jgi:hypothetical protein
LLPKYILLMKQLFCSLILVLFIACNNNTTKKPVTDSSSSATNFLATDFPQLNEIDSLDIHFFSDIKDLKIYKRVGVSNINTIDTLLVQQFTNETIPEKKCEFNLKFYCFSKNNFIKTIYVATQSQNCTYIAYIKSGGVVQLFQLSSNALEQLKQLQAKAQ